MWGESRWYSYEVLKEKQILAPTILWNSISQARTFPKVRDGKLDQGLGVGGQRGVTQPKLNSRARIKSR